jgi:hypothetical protein
MHLKAILIQNIQTILNFENHFCITVSKHKSILFNPLLIKINYIKLNFVKINYTRRQTKHTLDRVLNIDTPAHDLHEQLL